MSPSTRRPRRGDRLETTIDELDDKGRGVTRVGRFTVAARRALPGSRVSLEVVKAKGPRMEAKVVEVLEESPHRTEALCSHVENCGGCAFQELAYPVQLEVLRDRVGKVLAGVEIDTPVEPVVGMESPLHYRNKMEYTFASRRFREPGEDREQPADFALGLHPVGRYEKAIDLQSCAIHFEGADEIVRTVREWTHARGLEPWDVREHTGFLRYLVLRAGVRTGEILANLVTSRDEREPVDALGEHLQSVCPQVTTLVHTINSKIASTAIGESERVVYGPGVIHEEVKGLRYAISAGSFFQTNTVQAEKLFDAIAEEAALTGNERVYDLYCGAGTIGLALASKAAEVRGYEVVASAIQDARANAERNGIEGASFVEGDVLSSLDEERERGDVLPPDVAIVDPPRAGLAAKMVPALARLSAPRVVYVSCNVSSAARDLPFLKAAGYRVERVRPFDLFPHTPHVEVVFTLVKSTEDLNR